MAVDSSALTLAQWAKQANEPLMTKIVNSLYMNDNVMQDWRFVTKPTMKVNGARIKDSLPTVGWRKLNETAATTSGTPDNYSEQLYIYSNNLDIDRYLQNDQNAIGSPLGNQVNMYAAAVSYDLNDKFFNNNPVTGDADAPTGLRYRLDNSSAWGTNSACKIDAGGVVMTTALTAATANAFMEVVTKALQEVGSPDGTGCVIYTNRLLHRRWEMAVRALGAGGGFNMAKDAFDREVIKYRNATVRTIGVKADQSTEIITNTETSAGADGASDYTSLYVVRYGEDQFQPWQFEPMTVQYFPSIPAEPTQSRVHISHAVGYVQNHTRAIARVYDIKVS